MYGRGQGDEERGGVACGRILLDARFECGEHYAVVEFSEFDLVVFGIEGEGIHGFACGGSLRIAVAFEYVVGGFLRIALFIGAREGEGLRSVGLEDHSRGGRNDSLGELGELQAVCTVAFGHVDLDTRVVELHGLVRKEGGIAGFADVEGNFVDGHEVEVLRRPTFGHVHPAAGHFFVAAEEEGAVAGGD